MTSSRLDLAVGVIAAPGLDLLWNGVADLVDVLEVEPQTMWRPRTGGGWDVIDSSFGWVESRGKSTIVHGVGFPVGGCEPPDPQGVALTATCADRLGASHWSEHLSFNRVRIEGRDVEVGFFLPPAQTEAGVDAAVDHIRGYKDAGGARPFLIETGVNYLRPRDYEMSDGAFIASIAERSNCGILLDLHNLLTNQRNGRQSVEQVLSELPLDRVWEIHVAGGFELNSYYLDAHVGGPDLELLTLLEAVIPRLSNLRVVVFEAVPESMIALGAAGLREVLETLHQICDGGAVGGRWRKRPVSLPTHNRSAVMDTELRYKNPVRGPRLSLHEADLDATREWERKLAAYTCRVIHDPPADDAGLALLRALADQARLSQLTLVRATLLRNLINTVGVVDTEQLLQEYLDAVPPKRWPTDEGDQFAAWLATRTSEPEARMPRCVKRDQEN